MPPSTGDQSDGTNLGRAAGRTEAPNVGCTSPSNSEISRFFWLTRELLLIVSMDGSSRHVNPAWTDTLGWSREVIESAPILSLIHPDDVESVERTQRTLLRAETEDHSPDLLTRFRTSEGTYRWIDWHASLDRESQLLHAVGRDVTDVLEQQRASTAHEALLARLVAQLVEARSSEQSRVANQLHDGPVQNCIAALMQHDTAVSTGDPRHFADARTQIVSALGSLKRMMAGLGTTPPEDQGIEATIRSIAEEVAGQFQLTVEVSCQIEGRVPKVVGATACRVIREGLVNVGKHAGSPTARVHIEGTETSITAIVQDDGFPSGRQVDRTSSGTGMGMGLPGLRNVVREHGGELVVDVAESGTTLRASLPYA